MKELMDGFRWFGNLRIREKNDDLTYTIEDLNLVFSVSSAGYWQVELKDNYNHKPLESSFGCFENPLDAIEDLKSSIEKNPNLEVLE